METPLYSFLLYDKVTNYTTKLNTSYFKVLNEIKIKIEKSLSSIILT